MFIVQLIVFQIFVFAVLVIALRHVMSKNVSSAAARLQAMSEEYILKEEELKKEQSKMSQKYTEVLERAKKDAAQIHSKSQEATKKEVTDMINCAREESEQIVKRAENCTMETQKEMDGKVKVEADSIACKLVGHILPEEIKKQMHVEWVKDLTEGVLGSLEKMNIPADVTEAEIRSPYKLDPEYLDSIKTKFKTYFKREIGVKVTNVPELIAGIVVTIGSVVVDGSLLSRAKKVVEEIP